MRKLNQVALIFAMLLPLPGYTQERGVILPLPGGAWSVRSQCSTWAVALPVRDMSEVSRKVSVDGEQIYLHVVTGTLNISLWMQPINGYCDGSAQCAIAQKLKSDTLVLAAQSTELFEIQNTQQERFSAVEYFVKTWPANLPSGSPHVRAGDEINQLNVAAVMFKAGYWADIHISIAGPDVTGDKLATLRKSLRTILANTQVVPQKSECR